VFSIAARHDLVGMSLYWFAVPEPIAQHHEIPERT